MLNKALQDRAGPVLRAEAPAGGRGPLHLGQQPQRRRVVAGAGPRGPSGGPDDPLKNLDLKNLNDLPLAKLSETANAVWERIRASGINVKSSPPAGSQLLPPNMVPGQKGPMPVPGNGGPRTAEESTDLATGGGGSSKEQRLMAALAQVQDEKRQLADRAELLRANLSMLEAKNAKMAREVESAESGRSSALKLRDMLLEERDTLAVQLKAAQEELKRATEGMQSREGALEALRQSQQQLQEELKDAVTRLQAVDKSTEDLRSQLSSLETSRATVTGERDDLAAHLRQLVGMVDQLNNLFGGGEQQAPQAAAASTVKEPAGTSTADGSVRGADAAAPAAGGLPVATANASAQLQQLRATTEGAFAALQVARDELGALRSENQQLAQRAEALASSNSELTVTADSLRQQVGEARTELAEQRREAEAQREQLAAAVAELTAVKDAAAAAGMGLVELAQISTKVTALQEQLAASRATETALKRQLAATEVALLDTRRAAALTEARLTNELEAARRDADSLRAALHARTLATQVARRSGVPVAPVAGQFVNTNRFWVPPEMMFDFVKAVAAREVALVDAKGFLGIAVRSEPDNVMTVSTHWESIPAFEAWSSSPDARRHHYPSGVFQYVPRRGEGFPEDFMPFKDLNEAVNAKY